jgi:hypothetical protein
LIPIAILAIWAGGPLAFGRQMPPTSAIRAVQPVTFPEYGAYPGIAGADVHDLINLVGVIKETPYADPARLFLYGESRGGIMCLIAAKHNFPARAIAVWGAITDLGTFLAGDSAARRIAPAIWPGFPGQRGRDCRIEIGDAMARENSRARSSDERGIRPAGVPSPRDSARVGLGKAR